MSSWSIVCTVCGKEHPKDFLGFRCSCGGALDVDFRPTFSSGDLTPGGRLWRYRAAIPVGRDSSVVSLGEGLTPVIEDRSEGEEVFLKLEYLAPTGSFKDRGAAVLITRLKELGIDEILEDSSGNAGCALAAYAGAAGIRCRVLVPAAIPEGKALQIASYGAVLERISGSRDDVAHEALRRSAETFYASHNWQPFFLQGTKTFAYEVFEQVRPLPECIFFPVGNGSLLIGTYKGFQEMQGMGWIDSMPRLVGVQAASHAPIYTEVTGRRVAAPPKTTIAGGIAIGKPARLNQVAAAIRGSSGTVLVVDDHQIREAQGLLGRRGILVEPTAAAALAGYLISKRSGNPVGRPLIPLTGSGLKDLDSLRDLPSD